MAELDPLPDDLRRLLDAEQGSEDAPGAARDRVLMRLGGTFAVGATIAAGGTAAATSSLGAGAKALGRTGSAVRLARAATIFVAGAASGVGGQRAVEHLRAKAATPAPRIAPVAPRFPVPAPVPEEAPPAAIQPSPASEPPAVRTHRPAPAAAASAAPGEDADRLGAERALLEIARAALARGQAQGALEALARHEAAFPRGELNEEREGLYVQALIAAGRYDDARARAARFSRKYPRSLFAPAVTEALESIP